jgi:hypothetical protein
MSLSRLDDGERSLWDNAFWAGAGWRRGPFTLGARFWRVGWAFETPWGIRFLRNEEGAIITGDFYALTAHGAAAFNTFGVGVLTLGLDAGVKYRGVSFHGQDYNFNVELIKFEAYL